MEDFSPTDIALDYGYYQGHPEAFPWSVLAVVAVVLMQWWLTARQNR